MEKNIFEKIQLTKPQHSWFDLSHDYKTSFKMGKLIPVNLQEVIPGDMWKINSQSMFRMMPMIAPIMHKIDISIHHFFVPNRILWQHWEKFITGGDGESGTPALPIICNNVQPLTVATSTLPDYLGLPIADINMPTSALPFMAYQRIWQDYYADENNDSEAITNPEPWANDGLISDPSELTYLTTLRDRAWEHDYFTSCLPFAQKGDPVDLPIELSGQTNVIAGGGGLPAAIFRRSSDDSPILSDDVTTNSLGEFVDGTGNQAYLDPNSTMFVDYADATGVTTINDLRSAMALQKWLELNARGGTRYIESILAHFGVRSSDKRLNRSEYLGGSKSAMAISEVLQTSETSDTPQGTMAGHGISVQSGQGCGFTAEEHGYFISILSVRPRTAYFQGLHRMWVKTDRLQYYWPSFAYLGEQEVRNHEIYYSSNPATQDLTFGYIPRYSEYRYASSMVTGEMRNTLDFWNMARKFDSLPQLNEEFIRCNPTKRIFAVEDPDQDDIVGHIFHSINVRRPLPLYGNPGGL